MATENHNPPPISAICLQDAVGDPLQKAKAIVWLMANQSGDIINEEATRYAGIAASEYMDKALSAVTKQ